MAPNRPFEEHSSPVCEGDVLVISNRKVAGDTFFLELESRKIAVAARPGQFVMVRAGAGLDPLLPRPFSICSVRDGERIHILYRVAGKGTEVLSRVPPGGRVSVLGPLGRGFGIPPSTESALLVGGGIGVAPLVFLHTSIPDGRSVFLMGFPNLDGMIPLEVLGISPAHVQPATEDGSCGYRGIVTELIEPHLSGLADPRRVRIYACGPPAMLRRVARLALDHGVPCEVSLETRMACGLGACQGCVVRAVPGMPGPYHRVCREGPVFRAEEIDWGALGKMTHGKPSRS